MMEVLATSRWRGMRPYVIYGVLALAVMLPLLGSGYILTLDAVFTPKLRMPTELSNDYLWRALVHILNIVIASQIIEKLIFVGILLCSSIGMHQLLGWLRAHTAKSKEELSWHWAQYAAGILYAVNPFTYSRFMAGQYGVLLGYALLPLSARFLLEFARRPSRRGTLQLTGLALVVSIISIHTLGELVVLAICVLGVGVWRNRRQRLVLKQYALFGLMAAGLFVVLSSYWLVPLAVGKGTIATNVQQFDAAHTAAFATTGENVFAKIGNVLSLQGFWAEAHDLFVLPQNRLPGWGTIRILIWGLVAYGVVVCWRRARGLAITFLAIGAIGLLLAIGVLPGLAAIGYREPHKFAGLVALTFAVFVAYGAAGLLALAKRHSETRYSLAAVSVLLIILVFTPTMYWGFGGQLAPHQYPADWYTLNKRLAQEGQAAKAVFLPWYQYMSFGFSERIIANPAVEFFDTPMIISNDPELGTIRPSPQEAQTKIGKLVAPKTQSGDTLGKQLSGFSVRYVVLAKEYDYRSYNYLDDQRDLKLVWDTPSIKLYQVGGAK